MRDDDFNSSFEKLVEGLGSLVGEEEIEARRALGNERYERTVALIEATNALALKRDAAQVKYLESVTFLFSSAAVTLLATTLLGVAWSIYYWVR
jgi:hypothetical protein